MNKVRYRKIGAGFFADEKIRALSSTEKLVALYLLIGQVNRIGLYPFSPAKAQEELELSRKTFQRSFERVLKSLGWRFDPVSGVMFIFSWWKFNQPANPNVLIGTLDDLDSLPRTELLNDFAANIQNLSPNLHQTFTECLAERMPIQYQEQHQEQEQKSKTCDEASPVAVKQAVVIVDTLTTPSDQAPPKTKTALTWAAYEAAYRQRYGVSPVRNKKVNAQLAQFLTRVPEAVAPRIAEFYVQHPDKFYVLKQHPVGLLLHDAEGLHTQWKAQINITSSNLGVLDKQATIMNAFQQVKAKGDTDHVSHAALTAQSGCFGGHSADVPVDGHNSYTDADPILAE